MQYNFEWDPKKAKRNNQKHNITFELAATVFRDPRMLTIFDEEHSEFEERWVTLGLARNGILVLVVHTFDEVDENNITIRIISARKATKKEKNQYQELL